MGNAQDAYPFPALTVDIVIFTVREACLQVLLIQRLSPPFEALWALPGGFARLDESLEQAAQRKLEEETGVKEAYLEQLYTYGDLQRDPRGRFISVAYFALIPYGTSVHNGALEGAANISWFPVNSLPAVAFDHSQIIEYALRRLRYKLEYSAVGFELLPAEFTLSEIQSIYEIILGEKLDKRNFRRRMLEAGVIEATMNMRTGEGRPARCYRYRSDAIAEIKTRRLFP